MNEQILALVEEYDQETRKWRRHFHENPEVSTQEVETSKFLKEKVRALGLEIEEVPKAGRSHGHGFIATLDTGRPGKTIGLRADIDALPVTEQEKNLAGLRTCISKKDGVMHACGHDGHMAILLTVMNILNDLKESLSGKIIFIFEEGEEVSSGIHEMVKLLKNKNIDAFYGNHLASFLNTGEIAVDPGPVMTAVTTIDFKVIGKGGHGSRPDLSINPLYTGVDILNSLSVAWNNQLNIEKTVTLGITQFHVGEAYNVFADEARIGGTIRYFDVNAGAEAYEVVNKVAQNVAMAHNCRIEVMPNAGPSALPVINNDTLAYQAQEGVEQLYPGHLVEGKSWYASEPFAYYGKVAPYVYGFVGIKNEKFGSGAEHHNEYFDLDEGALQYAVGTMAKFAVDYLTK